jgi:hypothetical protein
MNKTIPEYEIFAILINGKRKKLPFKIRSGDQLAYKIREVKRKRQK